jgi:hypothetical protein
MICAPARGLLSSTNIRNVCDAVQLVAAIFAIALPAAAQIVNSPPTVQTTITVTANVNDSSILFPDPAQRVYVHQEILDANPGRPGAPLSIPGLPIETASGGIKAPQYFSPGVAGDHGEPIAEYIQAGTYLLSNNLSANAHGNGYADPNIMIPAILEGVQTDGGAFNVREGNHAEDLSAIYELRSRLEPFVTVTGDYRDVDVVAGWSPGKPQTDAWIAVEAAYGNGFLDRLEHRQQYKINGFRIWNLANHQITVFGIGYYGFSYVPGALVRSFLQRRMDIGLDFLIASGFTGQTTEVLAAGNQSTPIEQVVGVRLPSYVSVSYTYRFRPKRSF